jgi:hypothetical protein
VLLASKAPLRASTASDDMELVIDRQAKRAVILNVCRRTRDGSRGRNITDFQDRSPIRAYPFFCHYGITCNKHLLTEANLFCTL